ncbi:PRC-barrel domain-containing protein [Roseovarius sp. SCSIO 43702]|uniref:PRC-barrel domain-containing protein n=1 Tax=Roseovarius sp. SCSIO 43702 TaxID=2823043 RepID=UPI001C7323CB|nr:PRC-barrel domain-containing protein [Roseovarius sp. SCSIO 43702]QYX55977.1 PRC-barrel domain-containing protein [Roseovarius sp. SCSIO 43702]
MKTLTTTALAAIMATGIAGVATAQSATDLVEFDKVVIEPFGTTVEKIEDTDIYTTGGDKIGEIEDVLFTRDGKAMAVSAEVGGFLGIGEKEVVINLDQISRENDRMIVDMTEDEMKALPEWKD